MCVCAKVVFKTIKNIQAAHTTQYQKNKQKKKQSKSGKKN